MANESENKQIKHVYIVSHYDYIDGVFSTLGKAKRYINIHDIYKYKYKIKRVLLDPFEALEL